MRTDNPVPLYHPPRQDAWAGFFHEHDGISAIAMTTRSSRLPAPSMPLVLLIVLLGTLWLTGGASRADALGQVIVRGVCWVLLVVAILFGSRPQLVEAKPVLLLIASAIALVLLQLVPLPPDLWQVLPGRTLFAQAAVASGQSQPWRPLAIVPGAAINAAGSLIVPMVTYVLLVSLRKDERQWLPVMMLALVVGSTLVGLLQFSGARFNNVFVNDTPGEVSGTFANRNHFALLIAMGCALVPTWAFLDGRSPRWRAPAALGLTILLALTILSSGSRTGLALGAIGLLCGLLIVRKGIRRLLSRYPRWVFLALIAGIVAILAIFVLISVAADRAVAINRVLGIDPGQDMRSRGLPVVLDMIRIYFPIGSGFGGFDPVFRIHEPFPLLKLTYFNHAHNDWLEIVLDGGVLGALLLAAGVFWWARRSIRAWRRQTNGSMMLARLGSAWIGLALAASAFDYPARTPMIMTIIVIAAWWLHGEERTDAASPLPDGGQHL